MSHLFLSPHPDDAVLSCGGLMYQLVQAGEAVTVVTVMMGDVPSDVPISPFIEEHFVRWELTPDPVPGRKAEDTRAVESLGGSVVTGSFPDALYRTDGQGTALYHDLATLFGDPDPHDPVLARLDSIRAQLDPRAVIYAPLGAGHHVDHLLVREAILRWQASQPEVAVFWYEEYPYSANGMAVVAQARASLGRVTRPVIHRMNEAALAAKIRAIACYGSQISTFWPGLDAMADSVRRYAVQTGGGDPSERLWQSVS